MTTDLIRYDLLVQEALKGVVRRVLVDAARDGLPGEHHFYVSFRTDHVGVRISARLRERYPQDMTIVLQHQFDTLIVHDGGFEVGLSFAGVPERLRVPFEALTGFFDPSVQFGLKFEPAPAPVQAPADAGAAASSVPKIGTRRLEVVEETASAKGPGTKAGKGAAKKTAKDEADPAAGAEVVSLDTFRKKS